MKLLKKAISSLPASVMCIPSGILSFAETGEQNVITTATLSDVENGFMQFSEESINASTASQDVGRRIEGDANSRLFFQPLSH